MPGCRAEHRRAAAAEPLQQPVERGHLACLRARAGQAAERGQQCPDFFILLPGTDDRGQRVQQLIGRRRVVLSLDDLADQRLGRVGD